MLNPSPWNKVPQALLSTLSQPSPPTGQVSCPSRPQRLSVIDPVSIRPTVASTAMAIRTHFEPGSWRRRLVRRVVAMKANQMRASLTALHGFHPHRIPTDLRDPSGTQP